MKYKRNNLLTKNDLKDSLLELLKKKRYECITVDEICKRAGLNRSTFYYHYKNIDDLLVDIQREYFEEISNKLRILENKEYSKLYIIDFLKDIRIHDNKFKLFLEQSPNIFFFENTLEYFYHIYDISNDNSLEMYKAFADFSRGFMLLAAWIRNNYDISELELAKLMCNE